MTSTTTMRLISFTVRVPFDFLLFYRTNTLAHAGARARRESRLGVPACRATRSGPQQHLRRAALVHRSIGLGGVLERQLEVEHAARLDRARPDVGEQLFDVAAYRRDAAVDAHVAAEHLPHRQLGPAVGHAHVADHPAGARRAQ